jgi:LysM repeat protein
MTSNTISIQQMIQNAAEALRRGDKRSARTWAQSAASTAPEIEEPWLILAAVSNPRVSIEYLKQALLVNPGSPRAMRGLLWAQARLEKQPVQPVAVVSMSDTQPRPALTQPVRRLQAQAGPAPKQAPRKLSVGLKWLSMPALLLILLCFVAAWAVWPGSTSSALALIRSESGSGVNNPAWSLAQIARPTPTPTATAIPLRGAMSRQSPTATPVLVTPTPVPTDLPTSVPPTAVPPTASLPVVGNYTVQTGDTLYDIARRAGVDVNALAAANGIGTYSVIYAGQVLGIPQGGSIPAAPEVAPTTVTDPGVQPGGGKYILVSISQQHLYAYQDGALVYSFVASTGMNNSTRAGVFHVQDKIPNAYGATWNIWMPDWMGIYYSGSLENGIHALPILSNGSRLWAGYLGTPISFGCVVLGIQEAQELYDWADVGTTVEIRR